MKQNFEYPVISGNDADAKIAQLWDHLYRLSEQLNYFSNHIDADNMTAKALKSIKKLPEEDISETSGCLCFGKAVLQWGVCMIDGGDDINIIDGSYYKKEVPFEKEYTVPPAVFTQFSSDGLGEYIENTSVMNVKSENFVLRVDFSKALTDETDKLNIYWIAAGI